MPPKPESLITIKLKHLKSTYFVRLPSTATIGDVKARLVDQLAVTGGLRLEEPESGDENEDDGVPIPVSSFETVGNSPSNGSPTVRAPESGSTVTNILVADVELAVPNDKLLAAHALVWLPVSDTDKTKLSVAEIGEGSVLAFKLTLEADFEVILPDEEEGDDE